MSPLLIKLTVFVIESSMQILSCLNISQFIVVLFVSQIETKWCFQWNCNKTGLEKVNKIFGAKVFRFPDDDEERVWCNENNNYYDLISVHVIHLIAQWARCVLSGHCVSCGNHNESHGQVQMTSAERISNLSLNHRFQVLNNFWRHLRSDHLFRANRKERQSSLRKLNTCLSLFAT